tara:strand:+ start:594 stop:1082 length:489 start_codon:yes stop_codon:yes gene_type:complete
MRIQNIFLILILIILGSCIQFYLPSITIGKILVIPDIILVFITYISIRYDRAVTMIFAFVCGFFQDFITQIELIGLLSFTKTITGFLLGNIKYYKFLWRKKIKLIFIFCVYLLHFSIFYYVYFNLVDVSFKTFFQIILFQSSISFIVLFIIDRFVFDNKLIT